MECAMNIRTLAWIEETLVESGVGVDTHIGERQSAPWRGASIDSRGECTGRLFFALSGERTDGHEHVRSAFSAGAVAAIIDREGLSSGLEADGVPHFVVSDTLTALQKLARSYRDSVDIRVVAITGSGGKTTTKDYACAIMKTRYRVHSNPGNYNSTIGVPLTLLDTEEDAEYLVCEIGANRPGEIDFLARLVRADVGVITNIGDAHVGEFGSRDEIAAAKGELLDHISDNGSAVLPRDDDYFGVLRDRCDARLITFGCGTPADFLVRDVRRAQDGIAFSINDTAFSLTALGAYHALNACAAVAAAEASGIPMTDASRALDGMTPAPGRGRITRVAGVTIIDESYNASPASMALSLDMLADASPMGGTAVLGDMAELGSHSEELHVGIGRHIAHSGIGRVYWKGARAPEVRKGIEEADGAIEFMPVDDAEELVDAVTKKIRDGNVVLVKASRTVELDAFTVEFIARLRKRG